MTREELLARMMLAPSPSEEILYLVSTIDYKTMLPKHISNCIKSVSYTTWDSERAKKAQAAVGSSAWDLAWAVAGTNVWDSAWDLAWEKAEEVDTLWDAVKDAAWDAAFLATVMEASKHVKSGGAELFQRGVEAALDGFLWWLNGDEGSDEKMDYVNIGCVPCDEECAQVGDENYKEKARIECSLFKAQLEKQFPLGEFGVRAFQHDFGTYYEVVAYLGVGEDSKTMAAWDAENEAWPNWTGENRAKLDAAMRQIRAKSGADLAVTCHGR